MNFISLRTCKVSESHVENSQTSSARVSGFDWPASAPESASQLPAAAPSSSQRSGCVTRTLTWSENSVRSTVPWVTSPNLHSIPHWGAYHHTHKGAAESRVQARGWRLAWDT